MQSNFSCLFYLKKTKDYVSGPVPIYLRITVNGQRAEMSVGRDCLPEKWNSQVGLALGTKENIKVLNAYLSILQGKIHQQHSLLLAAGETVTAEVLKNKISGKEEKERSLVKIFQEHNKKIKALLNDEYAPATLGKYKTTLKHILEFLQWKYNVSDIDIKKIDHAFITEFEFYLRSVRKCDNNAAVKYVRNLGKIIRICLNNNWLTIDPFANYKGKTKEVERVFLVEEEIQTLISKEFSIERLSQVKDFFLFSCFTGLAYIDVKKLTKANINIGIDGEKWIFTKRGKTGTPSNIPLLPMAQAILNKYKDHPACLNTNRLLPVSSNQKVNSYLKEIADLCGFSKELTFHCARHTFATTVTLTNGVPLESVSKMLGHKSVKITQHYAKVVDRKVSNDMKLLREKFSSKNLDEQQRRNYI